MKENKIYKYNLIKTFCGYTNKFVEMIRLGDRRGIISQWNNKSVKINQWAFDGSTALHHAVLKGDVKLMSWLWERGADIEACDLKGDTALHYAVLFGKSQSVGWLLDRYADPYAKNINSCKPMDYCNLHPAFVLKRDVVTFYDKYLNLYDNYKGGVNFISKIRDVIFYQNSEEFKEVLKLLDKDDINFKIFGSTTLLHMAVSALKSTMVRMLLEKGADPNLCNRFGQTALHLIAYTRPHVCLAGLLIRAGVDINKQDMNGNTALHYAYEFDIKFMQDYLVKQGAATDVCNKMGYLAKNCGLAYESEKWADINK